MGPVDNRPKQVPKFLKAKVLENKLLLKITKT